MFSVVNASLVSLDVKLGKEVSGLAALGNPQGQSLSVSALSIPWHTASNTDPAVLLDWRAAFSTFVGRGAELQQLHHWAGEVNPVRISICFLHGPGGSGKSRLAAQLARSLQRDGWAAGFADLRQPRRFPLHTKGTLLVIDNPEENVAGVVELLGDLARADSGPSSTLPRLRVLFLTRNSGSTWMRIVDRAGATALVAPPLGLVDLSDDDAHRLYCGAQRKMVSSRGVAKLEPLSKDGFIAWRQRADENRLALFAMALAAYRVTYPADSAVTVCGRDIIGALVRMERRHWEERARDASSSIGQCGHDQTFTRLLSIACIAGSLDEDQALAQVRDGTIGLNVESLDDDGAVRLLSDHGLLCDGVVQGLQPDVFASAFVHAYLRDNPRSAPNLVWRAVAINPPLGATRACFMAHATAVTLQETPPTVVEFLATALRENPERCLLLEEFAAHPAGMPRLFHPVLAATVYEALVAADDVAPERRGGRLNNLANVYSELGRRPEALAPAEQAVAIYRRLSEDSPAAYEPDLATSLNNLANHYSELGRRPEALAPAEEAVVIRRLAEANPAAYEPGLAMSLNNLANRYSGLGRRPEALAPAEEAVAIYRRLSEDSPAAYEPDLAASLNNLVNVYSGLGRDGEARAAGVEAAAIRQRLGAAAEESSSH